MNKSTLISSVKALAAAILTASLLLFVFAFVALKADDPMKNIPLFAYITIPVSAAVGGVFCTRSDDKLLCALLFAAEFVVVMLTAGAVCGELFGNPLFSVISYLIIFLIPLAIALRSGSSGKRKNRSRKKYLRSR